MKNIKISPTKIALLLLLSFTIVFYQYYYHLFMHDLLQELASAMIGGENILSFSSSYSIFNWLRFVPLFIFWVISSVLVFFVYVSFDEIYSYLKDYLRYEFTYVRPKGHPQNSKKHRILKRITLHALVIVYSLAAVIFAFLFINPLSKELILLAQQYLFVKETNNFGFFFTQLPGVVIWFFYLTVVWFSFELFKNEEIDGKFIEDHNLKSLKKEN